MPNLAETIRLRGLRRHELLSMFPELEEDDQALLDTLGGMDDLEQQIARLLQDAEEEETLADARGALIAKYRDRKAKHEARSVRLKAVAMRAAQQTKIRKIKVPGCSASIATPSKGPVVILSEDAVPDKYCKIERTPKKKDIGEALDAGEQINYAKRGDPIPYWVIR
jgi:hypothetical protein